MKSVEPARSILQEHAEPMPGGRLPEEPPAALCGRLGFLLAKAHVGLRTLAEPALAPLGLDVKQFAVLTVLDAEGPSSQQRLVERLQVDRTTMVAIVDELERNGFAERRRNPEDRRAYSVHVTPKGQRALERAGEVASRAEAEFLARLPAADRRRLKQLLLTLISP